MNALTPTAQAVLDALREAPAAAAELRQRLGRNRTTIDKALTDLTRQHLAVKTDDDRWTLIDPTPDDSAAAEAQPDQPQPEEPLAEAADDATPGPDDAGPADVQPTEANPTPDAADGATAPVADEVKVCRGCQAQMPKICPTCWSKTTSYCGDCRRQQPTRRHGGTGQPEILASGLPKLGRGELARLVEDVMRTQPLPDHLGITGWTPGRIAVFLPGRSTGAIGNALDRLATTGTAELIADTPKRYRLTTHPNATPDDTAHETASGSTSADAEHVDDVETAPTDTIDEQS